MFLPWERLRLVHPDGLPEVEVGVILQLCFVIENDVVLEPSAGLLKTLPGVGKHSFREDSLTRRDADTRITSSLLTGLQRKACDFSENRDV